jgi:hypothetical protein
MMDPNKQDKFRGMAGSGFKDQITDYRTHQGGQPSYTDAGLTGGEADFMKMYLEELFKQWGNEGWKSMDNDLRPPADNGMDGLDTGRGGYFTKK